MEDAIRGKVFVLGDDVDTDQIIPACHLVYSLTDEKERRLYGRFALSGVPIEGSGLPEGHVPFVKEGCERSDYSILIAGKNFGCGSSREHAPFALREAGVKAIIAEFYARIFFRNTVNGGYLIPYESSERLIETIRTGDEVEVLGEEGILRNITRNEIYSLKSLGDVKEILESGNLFQFTKNEEKTK